LRGTVREASAQDDESLFFVAKDARRGLGGGITDPEEADDADNDADGPFNHQNPPPTTPTVTTVELTNAESQKTGESTGPGRVRAVE
jgi:hypothetical protein